MFAGRNIQISSNNNYDCPNCGNTTNITYNYINSQPQFAWIDSLAVATHEDTEDNNNLNQENEDIASDHDNETSEAEFEAQFPDNSNYQLLNQLLSDPNANPYDEEDESEPDDVIIDGRIYGGGEFVGTFSELIGDEDEEDNKNMEIRENGLDGLNNSVNDANENNQKGILNIFGDDGIDNDTIQIIGQCILALTSMFT